MGHDVIRGQATYLQRIAVPPGSSLRVQLVDTQLADTARAVVADITLRDVAGPPFAFELPFDREKLRTNGRYGVRASLRAPDGQLLFATDSSVPLTPGSDDVGELRMKMVGAGPATPSSSNADDAHDAAATVFRAVGNEPGWLVEVGRGTSPSLRAELDYGARRIEIARTQPLGNNGGFTGTANDGTRLTLRIRREPCSDAMSGKPFEAVAELDVDGRTLRGCGAFVHD